MSATNKLPTPPADVALEKYYRSLSPCDLADAVYSLEVNLMTIKANLAIALAVKGA